jgi:hypothetical protein
VTGQIFLVNDDRELVRMSEASYESEALLQRLLEDYSELLAGDQMDAQNPKRWLLVRREMDVPDQDDGAGRWSVDHLFLDQDGIPTLVEVKRATDIRARREVVAQMLDYAANAVLHWPVERIQARFESRCEESGEVADDVLADFLGPDADIENFWRRVSTNLQAKRIRLLFVADSIPKELRHIVEFLNEQLSQTEVLAVEVKQYRGEGLTTLVPRLIGQTSLADQRKRPGESGRPSGEFDEEKFFSVLSRNSSPAGVAVARHILEWSRERGLRIWGGADSFFPMYDFAGQGFHFLAVKNGGRVQFQFQWMRKRPFDTVEKRDTLRRALNSIPGVDIPEDRLTGKPSVPLESFAGSAQTDVLLRIFQEFIDGVEMFHRGTDLGRE